MRVSRMVGLFGVGVGLFACGSSTPPPTEPPPTVERADVAPPAPPGPPILVGTVKDQTGTLVQGVTLVVNDGKEINPRLIADAVSDEHGEFHVDVDLGEAVINVRSGNGILKYLEHFHLGENRVDIVIDGAELARMRDNVPPAVCPSSKPGTIVDGHTTTQKDIDELAHAILERGKVAIPDYPASGNGDINVIAEIGHRRRLSTNALPPGFAFADPTALQAQANLSRDNVGFIQMHDIWSDGTCATVIIGGDIAVPDDPNIIKMCCCKASAIYEKRGPTWVFVKNAWTMCS